MEPLPLLASRRSSALNPVMGSVLLGALLALDGADLSAYVAPRVDVELRGRFGDNMATHPA